MNDGLDQENNKYFTYANTSSKRNLAPIFENNKYKPVISRIKNVENSSSQAFKQTPLPRWVSEEELFAFEKESVCPFIENEKNLGFASENPSLHENTYSRENPKEDSFLKQDKPKNFYSRNKEDQNSENGVDELMKLYPLSCCDELVRSQISTNYVQ